MRPIFSKTPLCVPPPPGPFDHYSSQTLFFMAVLSDRATRTAIERELDRRRAEQLLIQRAMSASGIVDKGPTGGRFSRRFSTRFSG